MGQGSGGSAASLLALSPEGRSATGVAALSGTPLSPGAVRSDPKQHASALANHTGCPTEPPERLVLCLRQMPAEKVVMVRIHPTKSSIVQAEALFLCKHCSVTG